jgi:hypothetical protein
LCKATTDGRDIGEGGTVDGRDVIIEILHTEGCGRWREAAAAVERAVAAVERSAAVARPGIVVRRVLVADQAAAERLRFPGSPTVRVNDADIQPEVAARVVAFGLG